MTSAFIQPIASDDVADAMTRVAIGPPQHRIVEIGGPDKFSMAALAESYLEKTNDPRTVITDDKADYFGAILEKDTLIPGPDAHLGKINFETWFAAQPVKV
jgi:uncharacterized protein YbjT (DUF2867 family)